MSIGYYKFLTRIGDYIFSETSPALFNMKFSFITISVCLPWCKYTLYIYHFDPSTKMRQQYPYCYYIQPQPIKISKLKS